MRLTGKVALVTGAADARSIGWGIAQALAEEGADVLLNDLPDRQAELADRAAEIRDLGRRAVVSAADVSRPEQVEAMLRTADDQLGGIDIACSNAGIIRWERLSQITPRSLRAMVNVNLKGNMLVCQGAARRMIEADRGGRIIINSSVQVDRHFPATPVYGATRRAVPILVGGLALELAPYRVTVNHVGPGWLRTAINDPAPDQQTPEDIEAQRAAVPLGRPGEPREIGQAVVYLASDDAAYTTGAFIRVDGGLGISKYAYTRP